MTKRSRMLTATVAAKPPKKARAADATSASKALARKKAAPPIGKAPAATASPSRPRPAAPKAAPARAVTALAPVRPPIVRRSEKVSESVAREIIRNSAGLPPGSTLPPESAMLEHYGVSRGSLREALRILEVQGLIVIKPGPGGGPILRGPESATLGKTQTLFFHLLGAQYRDLVNARRQIEPMLVGLAAQRQDREALEPLRAFLAPTSPSSWSDPEYLRIASDFHSTVTGLSGNPILTMLCHALHDIALFRLRDAGFSDSDRLRSLRDHATIAKAVLDGNAKKAETLMREHMIVFTDQILSHHAGLVDEIIDWH